MKMNNIKRYFIFMSMMVITAVLFFGNIVTINAASKDYNICIESGCRNTRKSNRCMYCYSHACSHGSCTSKRISGSRYCSSHTCAEKGCNREVSSANQRCSTHKKTYNTSTLSTYKPSKSSYKYNSYKNTSSKSKKTYHDSYDDGYNDIYEDEDYDWDRYYKDDDYARGVDDALDDWEEYGDDW